MIPALFIEEWRQTVPWISSQQVEQDLVISRAIVEIYSDATLSKRLAFRGGTALHKLYFDNPRRYSEDLDFIQVDAEPIGDTLDILRTCLDPWLGTPRRTANEGLVKLIYKFNAEADDRPLKLKIEINTREHFAAKSCTNVPFQVNSKWFTGSTDVTSIKLNWLLGSKLRALYQRRKGRDLYDLYLALQSNLTPPADIIQAFSDHLLENSQSISRAEFERNLYYKLSDRIFLADVAPLLTESEAFDMEVAHGEVASKLLLLIPGNEWKRER